MTDREAARAAFAAAIAPHAPRIRDAFARVPREAFLPPGPWQIVRLGERTIAIEPSADAAPERVDVDAPIMLVADKQLTNGQPSAHATWLAAADPRIGDRVIHVGAGAGYYTAILAELVGPSGRVVAHEIEPALVAAARANLAAWPWATVEAGSAIAGPADVIYVNAGATHVPPTWLDALAPGGRMLIPITAHVPAIASVGHGFGFMLRLERGDGERWPATIVSPVGIYDAAGVRKADAEAQVLRALGRGALGRLVVARDGHPRGDGCVVHVAGSCVQRAK